MCERERAACKRESERVCERESERERQSESERERECVREKRLSLMDGTQHERANLQPLPTERERDRESVCV